ncbi:MAG TPA: autotransporter assembly complex family protein, partial [Pararhizobium sp.]|nr:autotransporter assembly complex family protein [Pararhizobium sp.]
MGVSLNSKHVAAALAIGLALAPARASAFQLFGMTFFESKAEKNADVIGEPLDYKVKVTVTPESRTVKNAVENASGLYSDRKKPASGAAGLIAKARSDYKSILAALYGQGYYGGVIHILIDGKEADGLPPDVELAAPAQVAINIDPGPLFRFGRTRIVNAAPPPVSFRDEVDSPAAIGFVPGEPARSGVVLKAEKLATDAWRQQGHPKAKVKEQELTADHRTDHLNVTLGIEPGPRAVYGPVTVEGTKRMDPRFVARMTDLKPGQEYDPDDIKRANDRLTKLDVFRSMKIEEADQVGPDGILPITVHVQERKLHRIGIGATYSTLDGGGLSAFWLHRDLFGHAEHLRVDGMVGGLGETIDPKKFDYSLGVTFTRPGIFDPDTDLIASVFGKRQVLDPYTETSIEGKLGFSHYFSPELTGDIAGDIKRARFDDDFGTRDFLTVGLPGTLTFDSRDSTTDPTQGWYLQGGLEPFYEFDYGNAATRMTAEARTYYGFGARDRVVLAGRVKIGSLVGAPIDETPPDKLFFAGGGGSIRGYDYQSIGVRDSSGRLTGGRSLFETSAEVRAKITDTIGIVGFVDAGTVSANSFIDFSEPLKVGVGAGLRYYTGLGPIRLDVA